MARARKSEKNAPTPVRKPKPVDPDRPAKLRRLRHRLQNGLGTVALLTLGGVGYHYCWNAVKADLLPQAPPQLVLEGFPQWLGPQGELLVRNAVGAVPATSPLDPDALLAVRSRLEAEPWVRRVDQVRRKTVEGVDTIEAICEYRAPVALVESGGFFWMVDAEGVLLPRKLGVDQLRRHTLDPEGNVRLRRIENVTTKPPHPGEPWLGEDLQAALRMEALVRSEPWATEVSAIDVANFEGRRDPVGPHVTLRTKQGSALGWGRAPGDEDPLLEIATEAKAARLRHLQARFGRIDLNAARTDHRDERILVFPNGGDAELAKYADLAEGE